MHAWSHVIIISSQDQILKRGMIILREEVKEAEGTREREGYSCM